MRKPSYIKQFEKLCPSLNHLWADSAMGLWSLLYWEFWGTLGHAPRKTEEILRFSRFSISPGAHAALREGVTYAFGEHLLDQPKQFHLLAKYLTTKELDAFAEPLISWNGKIKYARRRHKLEKLLETNRRIKRRRGKSDR